MVLDVCVKFGLQQESGSPDMGPIDMGSDGGQKGSKMFFLDFLKKECA